MYIGTVRFNNDTYIENYSWRIRNNYSGCIYSLRHRTSKLFPPFCNIIVVEMNNTIDKIMGIGYLYNHLRLSHKEKIHENVYQNRYIYKGEMRIDRVYLDPEILNMLELMVFKTSGHYKRNRSIIQLPLRRLGKQIKKEDKKTHNCPFCPRDYKYIKRLRCHLIKDHDNNKEINNYVKEIDRYLPKNNKNKKTVYKCSLCGKCKKNHICKAVTYSDEQRKKICNYLEGLFTK
tara:strand:+ start:6732 stop:7427 length:696 start_codon:yes stop_codon:yes gene_type:complete